MNKLFLTILLGVLLIGIVNASWSASLDNGLVAYYTNDYASGNLIDSLGNYNLTAINIPVYNQTGVVNKSIKMGQYSGYFNGSISGVDQDTNSIVIWFNRSEAGTGVILFGNSNFPASEAGMRVSYDNTNVICQVNDAGYGPFAVSPLPLDTNFHQVVCIYNGTTIHQYIDGEFTANSTWDGRSLKEAGNTVVIGSDISGFIYSGNYSLDEIAIYNRTLTTSEITELYNLGAGCSYGYCSLTTNISLDSPLNDSLILDKQKFNVSLNIYGGIGVLNEWDNITYNVWFENGTLYNSTLREGLSGNSTSVSLEIGGFFLGSYYWNVNACYANTTYSNCSSSNLGNYTFYNTSVFNTINYSTVAYETDYENILYNITVASGLTPTSAKLFYNGTEYSMTITNTGGTNYTLSKLLSITSSMVGSNTFYITYNLSSTYKETSSTYNQLVNPILFGWCNTTLTTSYFNISFKDESTAEIINATIPTSTFYYWLGDSTLNKSFTYSNTTLNYNYPFCFIPQNKTLYLKPLIQYNNPSYEQRTYEPSTLTLTNATTNTTLYLLSTTDGIYVTFQVTNQADQVLSGVSVSGTRLIGSTLTTVASGITDSSGGVTFWLNYHYSHAFTFIKDGYETYTVTLTPTQTSYTISLSSTSTITTEDYTKGIKTYIYPKGREMYNNTIYNVIFNMTSSYYTLDSFGFRLRLSNGTIVGSASSTIEGTGASYLFNSSNYTSVYMDYYWVIDGNYTNSSTRWIITNSLYTDWSIKTFFDDLEAYLDSGIFGLDEFGRYLIAFLILFLIVGFMGYKFGMVNPIFISVLTFSVVFFLDVITGLIPDVRGIEHLVTYVAGLIAFLVIVGGGSR